MKSPRILEDRHMQHLVQLAAGLLKDHDGDIEAAMKAALEKHFKLIQALHQREIVSDLGPGNAILFIPETGGLAMRLERHPSVPETEEVEYPEVDLFDFEVYEPPSQHNIVPRMDELTLDEGY